MPDEQLFCEQVGLIRHASLVKIPKGEEWIEFLQNILGVAFKLKIGCLFC